MSQDAREMSACERAQNSAGGVEWRLRTRPVAHLRSRLAHHHLGVGYLGCEPRQKLSAYELIHLRAAPAHHSPFGQSGPRAHVRVVGAVRFVRFVRLVRSRAGYEFVADRTHAHLWVEMIGNQITNQQQASLTHGPVAE